MQVLMVGATGSHAHLVLRKLTKRNVAVRALVRDQERAAVALHNGADEAAIGDLTEPASQPHRRGRRHGWRLPHRSGARGGGGADGRGDGRRRARCRCAKVVFSAVIHPSISAMTNHAAKLSVEEALYSSEMDFTVLQPARFMQNFERSWNDIVEHGRFAAPYSLSSKMCSVDYRDVAEVAAMAMTGNELSYGTFELCAPGMLDSHDTAVILSEVLGRLITAVQIPLDQFASQLPEGPFREGMSRMMPHYDRHGLPGGNPLVLRAILGREPRSLKDYFRELASR
jgi:uncharacterized protein YbjT (DUF2867 family)